MAEIQAAGAILYVLDKKTPRFLILRSARHGEWGPPKGHSDEGESEIETAMREVYEETGLRRAKFKLGFREVISYSVERKGKRKLKEVVFFLCEMPSEEIKISDEHTEAHLATIDEIETMIPHEDIKEVFRKADAFIRNETRNAG
jgi:8-oxo-dGTP pyrophosphatase MutT (NUDIX family)